MAKLAEAIRRRWVRRTLLFAAVVGMGLWAWTRNPLPSDESMIAFFYEHRADLEELVRRYRRFEPGPNQSHNLWLKQGDTPELLKRAKVYNIDHSATGYPWYPNPYSVETGKLVEDDRSGLARWHKYGALMIKPAPRDRYYAFTLHRAVVWKEFFFFPEVPRIENGVLLGPVESNGRYSFRKRVLPSLNRFPIHWRSFECVYRQIEPQWFLCMCNGH